MRELPDLFGEIPVTWPEVRAWCRRVAGIDNIDDTRGRHYVRAWCVVDKVRAAKARGEFTESGPGRLQ